MTDYIHDHKMLDDLIEQNIKGRSLFDRLGGRTTLDRVHKIFYDKIYQDSWMSQYFAHVDQKIIESKQSDFFSQLTGGPKLYSGRMPLDAHMHINITSELFDYRHNLLRESLLEAQIPEKERTEWLNIDLAFRRVLVKISPDQLKKRYNTDTILDFLPPTALSISKKAAS